MARKVCVVITARPSYSRVRSLLTAIRERSELELQLVVSASALLDRYGNAYKVIESEGFRIDRRVYMILEGENLVTQAKSTGLGMAELATVFDNLEPDMVVSIADRFETMATAVAASYLNIPLVHVQGGEVTGSIDEKVRHAITKLADLHFVATKGAAERVIRLGERAESVFVTGCPSIDAVRTWNNGLAASSFNRFQKTPAARNTSIGAIAVEASPPCKKSTTTFIIGYGPDGRNTYIDCHICHLHASSLCRHAIA